MIAKEGDEDMKRFIAVTITIIIFSNPSLMAYLKASNGTSTDSFMFNGHHIMISDQMVKFTDEEVDDKFLEMLLSLGVDSISIYVSNSSYERYAYRYDRIINRIKEEGRKLVLLPYILPKKDQPLDDHFRERMNVTLFHVKRYRPDFVIILNEPSIIGGVEMPADVLERYAENVSAKVREISPSTKIVVTVHSYELFLLPHFVKIDDIDIIGINQYSDKNLENVKKAIDYIKENGKEAWIWETWWRTQKIGGGEKLPFKIMLPRFRSYKHQDEVCEWLSFIYNFDIEKGLKVMNPFFTEQFIYCNFPPYIPLIKQFTELIEAIKGERRTMSYYFYKDLIDAHKNGKVHLCITRPINCLYIYDREMFPLRQPYVLGRINVKVEAFNTERVEFFVDGKPMFTDEDRPFEWLWEKPAKGKHNLKVVAYGQDDSEEKEITVYVI